jgi:hypothetical protein
LIWFWRRRRVAGLVAKAIHDEAKKNSDEEQERKRNYEEETLPFMKSRRLSDGWYREALRAAQQLFPVCAWSLQTAGMTSCCEQQHIDARAECEKKLDAEFGAVSTMDFSSVGWNLTHTVRHREKPLAVLRRVNEKLWISATWTYWCLPDTVDPRK